MMDRGPKHVEFYYKNKFEKSVHVVGFIIRAERLSAMLVLNVSMQSPSMQFCHIFLHLLNLYKHTALRLMTK